MSSWFYSEEIAIARRSWDRTLWNRREKLALVAYFEDSLQTMRSNDLIKCHEEDASNGRWIILKAWKI